MSHCDGSVRNGLIGAPVNGVSIATGGSAVGFKRSRSCAGSPGTPHSVSWAPRGTSTSVVSFIVAITE